eukprot:11317895-Karenia_brevis.AAC.1
MAALKLITSSDKPRLPHLIGQWRQALPLPTLLTCWNGRAAITSAMMPPLALPARWNGCAEADHIKANSATLCSDRTLKSLH